MSKYCPIEEKMVTYLFCQECEDKYCDPNYLTCRKNCIYFNTCKNKEKSLRRTLLLCKEKKIKQ